MADDLGWKPEPFIRRACSGHESSILPHLTFPAHQPDSAFRGSHRRECARGDKRQSALLHGYKLTRTGKAKVTAKVTYTPDGGDSNTKGERIKLIQP